MSATAGVGPPPAGGLWAGAGTAAGAGLGGTGGGFVKPLADSLSPDDAYHLREALVAAVSAPALPSKPQQRSNTGRDKTIDEQEEDGSGHAAAIEERRVAALELLLSAVKEQPALVVVLFWAQPATPRRGSSSPPPASEEAVIVGGAALSGAVLSALNALSVELADGQRGLAGGGEALVVALELVLALWHAEGVGRLGQVSLSLIFFFCGLCLLRVTGCCGCCGGWGTLLAMARTSTLCVLGCVCFVGWRCPSTLTNLCGFSRARAPARLVCLLQ